MPDGISNVDSTILKLANDYQRTLEKSRELNEERATIRDNVEKLGIDPLAFQAGLRMARDMTNGERSDYTSSLNRVLGVLDGKEADLFGADEVAKRNKRAEKRAEKEAKATTAREAQDDKSDANPRSDPKAGGAGKGKTIKEAAAESDAALKASVAAAEQKEGGEILDDAIDSVKAQAGQEDAASNVTPLAQSAQAKKRRAEAGLN